MKKIIIVEEPVFKSASHLFWGYSFQEFREFLSRKGMPLDDSIKGSQGLSVCVTNDEGVHYHSIWLKSSEWTLKTQAVFVHELAHLIFDIFSIKGINIIKENPNEVYCYLYEYYFYEFCVQIQKLIDAQSKGKCKKKTLLS